MIMPVKYWRAALFTIYIIVIAPAAFACDAQLNLLKSQNFVNRATLGSPDKYTQRVYSGHEMSYSVIRFPSEISFDEQKARRDTARSMASTVSSKTKIARPIVKALKEAFLSRIDQRLVFLNYIDYENAGKINLEASAAIQNASCWAILRFTAVSKNNKEEALNVFASLVKNTELVQ